MVGFMHRVIGWSGSGIYPDAIPAGSTEFGWYQTYGEAPDD